MVTLENVCLVLEVRARPNPAKHSRGSLSFVLHASVGAGRGDPISQKRQVGQLRSMCRLGGRNNPCLDLGACLRNLGRYFGIENLALVSEVRLGNAFSARRTANA
jgi:hypothetical protein